MAERKFEIVESIGDTLISDVELSTGQRSLIGKLQNAKVAFEQKQAEFAEYLDQIKKAEEELANFKKLVYKEMLASGAKSVESDRLKFTLTLPTTRFSIDTQKLKTLNPKLFEEVKKIAGRNTPVSGYVKITDKLKNVNDKKELPDETKFISK